MTTGAPAVGAAQATQTLAQAETVQQTDYVREVGGRVFLFMEGVWLESTYEKGTPTVDLVYLGDAFLALLSTFPEVGPMLALGERVVFKVGSAWVQIGEEGLTELTPEVLDQLSP